MYLAFIFSWKNTKKGKKEKREKKENGKWANSMANIAGGVVKAHTMLAIELGISITTSCEPGGPGGTAVAGRVGVGSEGGGAVRVTVVAAAEVKKEV
jgi:hypothetical protein